MPNAPGAPAIIASGGDGRVVKVKLNMFHKKHQEINYFCVFGSHFDEKIFFGTF